MKIGLKAGIEIRNANLARMLLPASIAILIGILIVVIGRFLFDRMPGIKRQDGIATAGFSGR